MYLDKTKSDLALKWMLENKEFQALFKEALEADAINYRIIMDKVMQLMYHAKIETEMLIDNKVA